MNAVTKAHKGTAYALKSKKYNVTSMSSSLPISETRGLREASQTSPSCPSHKNTLNVKTGIELRWKNSGSLKIKYTEKYLSPCHFIRQKSGWNPGLCSNFSRICVFLRIRDDRQIPENLCIYLYGFIFLSIYM
jgi:hypothetical protein